MRFYREQQRAHETGHPGAAGIPFPWAANLRSTVHISCRL